ncbi:GTP diphosphokinase [Pelagibaculum spongiae]|uniref:GTP pyrophosphokinase n=1 Tax=Pelagibaculum spongiae TaxID=2080658 RepID=A0A2V1GTA2_9GAMM|nr:GTP diphosphokinase [Pelagibaculum spongiae]PVZ64925.1 GTP diphosphokinase [Pelagibaculum spongiae]
MVKVRDDLPLTSERQIDLNVWLEPIMSGRQDAAAERLIRDALELARVTGRGVPSLSGSDCLDAGMSVAEILNSMGMDHQSVAAGLIFHCVEEGGLSLEDVEDSLGRRIASLVRGVIQMDSMGELVRHEDQDHQRHRVRVEHVRKMLLAMVQDVRVVLIKLAERLCYLRAVKHQNEHERKTTAREVKELYAPLANRLGVGQMKWEMEDLSFRYLETDEYKRIAKLLDQRRVDREQYIKHMIELLEQKMQPMKIEFEVMGRIKHIFSIWKKMQRKQSGFEDIYDVRAVRILVPEIEDCYLALGMVHADWNHIPEEFDDYVATPKPNGYRSIHTAINGPEGRVVEVQIRTFAMHQESELGVAAHWRYKEGSRFRGESAYEAKIAWLRQLLDWQAELGKESEQLEKIRNEVFADRVYVFTPNGDIIDLPAGSTPLDFAYHVHTELGHHCKGAKVNGQIVPLNYQLQTSDRIDIMRSKQPVLSRDWLRADSGYLCSSRARAKVHHWFKQQDKDIYIADGRTQLNKSLQQQGLDSCDMERLSLRFNYHTIDDMFAGIGAGDLKIGKVLNAAQDMVVIEHAPEPLPLKKPSVNKGKGEVYVEGADNLLTKLAQCCKPVIGDPIVGFITQGRGITIHRRSCSNLTSVFESETERLVEVGWTEEQKNVLYPVDLIILADDRSGLLAEIMLMFVEDKINVTAVNTTSNRRQAEARMIITIEIRNGEILQRIINRLQAHPALISVSRRGKH